MLTVLPQLVQQGKNRQRQEAPQCGVCRADLPLNIKGHSGIVPYLVAAVAKPPCCIFQGSDRRPSRQGFLPHGAPGHAVAQAV